MRVLNDSTLSPAIVENLRRWRDWRIAVASKARKKPSNLIYDVDEIPPLPVQISVYGQDLDALDAARLSTTQLSGLATTTIVDLTSAQADSLTAAQIGALAPGQVDSLSAGELQAFSAAPE